MIKRRYTYNEKELTAQLADGYYLWTAFLGESGISKFIKSPIFDPTRILYEINLPVDKVVAIGKNNTYIWVAVEDSNYVGIRINRTNPLSTLRYYSKPIGIIENPVDITVGNNIYFLIPGIISGENAKLLRFNLTSTSLQESIELDIGGVAIRNASSVDIDVDNEILYIATNEDPITLAKLEDDGGWTLSSWQIE
ncbi:MAG: hypothetical protein JW924_03270 [Fusobacteriaceae bacterium]|nr:hypothetical protein [Fusobacteriaceae bacterium]